MGYTSNQSANTTFRPHRPGVWVVFLPEAVTVLACGRWSGIMVRLPITTVRRTFDLERSDQLSDLQSRLVIGWRSPRTWALRRRRAPSGHAEIADAEPVRFPGFDAHVGLLKLQAVVVSTGTPPGEPRSHRSWASTSSPTPGTVDGTSARQAAPGVAAAGLPTRPTYGGNELRDGTMTPVSRCCACLTLPPTREINAESHYKRALPPIIGSGQPQTDGTTRCATGPVQRRSVDSDRNRRGEAAAQALRRWRMGHAPRRTRPTCRRSQTPTSSAPSPTCCAGRPTARGYGDVVLPMTILPPPRPRPGADAGRRVVERKRLRAGRPGLAGRQAAQGRSTRSATPRS